MKLWIPDALIQLFAPRLVERVAREGEVKADIPVPPSGKIEATARADRDEGTSAEPATA